MLHTWSIALAVLAACGAERGPRPLHNRPTSGDPSPTEPPSPSCRAAVEKTYDDGHDEYIDPRTGGKLVVTTSDVCGLILEPIYFEQGSARLEPGVADGIAGMLACIDQTEHRRFRIELIGHANSDEPSPEQLALERAQAVERYFTACGVPVLGLTSVSAGAREPLEPETTERARALSRRVSMLIVERRERE